MKNKVFIALLLAAAHSHAGEYQLKHRSAFGSGDTAHNPFWPIGWTKSSPIAAVAVAPSPLLKADDFTVTTIMLNDPPLAVINGKEIAEGEIIAMHVGNEPVFVQLASVQDGQVVLRCRNQNIVVPLRRKGIPPAAPVSPADPKTALR